MSNTFETLSDNEIQRITRLVQTLDQSTFEFLQLELGEVRLTIGKGGMPATPPAAAAAAPLAAGGPSSAATTSPGAPATTSANAANTTPAAASATSQASAPAAATAPEGTVAVLASTMGRFYSRPEPTAEPYVSVGSAVDEGTTVGLIEVMKLFNAVSAGVSGTVAEICVEDGQIVEHGQVLLRVMPLADGAKALS